MLRLLGDKLRYLRNQYNLTQAELARRLGAKRAHVNNIEAGRRASSLDLILKLADLFGVTTDYLLHDTIPIELSIATQLTNQPVSKYLPTVFGAKLRRLRLRHNMTQAELAGKLALTTHAHISFLETGSKEPSVDLVIRIANYFGASTDYLLRDSIPIDATNTNSEDDAS